MYKVFQNLSHLLGIMPTLYYRSHRVELLKNYYNESSVAQVLRAQFYQL